MSPEDDHLQTDEVIPTITDRINNDWPTNNILKQNGNDSNTWLPLLNQNKNTNGGIDHGSYPPTNNNKWSALTSPGKLPKCVWHPLPQDDEMGLFNATNGNSLNGLRNGHSNKPEQESLTGVVRLPKDDNYSNDGYDGQSDCGIGLLKPRWARAFASTHVFMVVFLLAWILQVN